MGVAAARGRQRGVFRAGRWGDVGFQAGEDLLDRVHFTLARAVVPRSRSSKEDNGEDDGRALNAAEDKCCGPCHHQLVMHELFHCLSPARVLPASASQCL